MHWPWQKEAPKKIETPPVCNHKYKDFPWYVESVYHQNWGRLECKVIEPFVCVLCKCRKNVVLEDIVHDATRKEANKWLEEYLEDVTERIQPRALVEDMIADVQLVDREFLKYYEMVHNVEASTPKLEIPKDPNPVSPDQLMQWIMAKNGIEPYTSHFKDIRGNEVHTIKPLTKEEIEQWNGA